MLVFSGCIPGLFRSVMCINAPIILQMNVTYYHVNTININNTGIGIDGIRQQ